MDDEDSQDELINRNTSHSKGKKAAIWAISDDSDDDEDSEEVESNSGEEGEEDHLDEQEEEEDETEEEDDGEEEEDAKAEDGAFGGTSADLAGLSSDEDSDKCPICLNSFSSQPVATPENCEHYFCLDCILEWAKNANSCPIDRIAFNSIYLRKCYGGKVKKVITIQKPVKEGQEERVDVALEQTNCEVCGGSDREDRLLLCDGCDAGYHMECLTPPLDSVPVEEWFCPECEVNNRHPRVSAEEISDTENLPSTARPATSRSQSTGQTRAIARTQQSERVRANVNRHRISQARTSQLAPTYLIQSSWLDETINAVVAGLNTSVYVRDFRTPVPPNRRRKTRKRRKVKRKITSSSVGKKGNVASTGIKRKKRKARRSKSRKKLVLNKATTSRSRIANSLGIVKDKKSSSLPTVYRPSEHTLSGMRSDIGAPPFYIFGNPFDLDPFVDDEGEEQQLHVTSLLEAKRRGISRSALRSHQPVARPVTAGLSRAMDVPQSGGVVEAAPVPDLLGSILSAQNLLFMDSSDVVINRDGTLTATKPIMPSALKPSCSKSNSLGDTSPQINTVMSPNPGDCFPSPHYNEGSCHNSSNSPFSQSSCLPTHMPSSASYVQPSSQDQPRSQPRCPSRQPSGHRGINGLRASRPSSSTHFTLDTTSKSNGRASLHSQSQKAPIKPMWVDVSGLPRIPKIKRESNGITNDSRDRSSNISANSRNYATSSNSCGMPETGMNSYAGDRVRQQSVDQQKGRVDSQSQRPRPETASSSTLSNSISSSSAASPASQPCYSSSSTSSSAVSFRINSSGNSWHSRRLSLGSSSASGGRTQEPWRETEDEARKRQLHRDKQMLLASRTLVSKDKDSNNIYDPFNPTLSDSSSSDDEDESTSLDDSSIHTTHDGNVPNLGNEEYLLQSKQDLVHVKTETQEKEISEEEPSRANAQESISQEVRHREDSVKVETETRLVDTGTNKQASLIDTKVKKESVLQNAEDAEGFGERSLNSETADSTPTVHQSLDLLKTERETLEKNSSARTPNNAVPKCKNKSPETKLESKSCSKYPLRDSGQTKKAPQASKERYSSSPETDRGRKGNHHSSDQGCREKEKKTERKWTSRRSRSRDKRRARSTSGSSQSSSPDRTPRKRRRSRSQSKDRGLSRSVSSSSSRERSRRKKRRQRSEERHDCRDRDSDRRKLSKDKRHDRSRSNSRSKSRSRSRSKDYKRGRSLSKSRSRSRERKKDLTRVQQSSVPSTHKGEPASKYSGRHRSRSCSRERRKKEATSSKRSQKTSGFCISSSKDTKQLEAKRKEKTITQRSLKGEKAATVKKHEAPTSKESKDIRTASQATTAEMAKESKVVKEIKKEKQSSFDIFEDSPVAKTIKKEEPDIHALMVVKDIGEEGNKDSSFKTETCEISISKSEPSSQEICSLTSVASFCTLATADSPQNTVSQSQPASTEQPNTVELTLHVKQEVQQPSDSEDDFSVDVMLDSLDYKKSECTDGSSITVKQEKGVDEGTKELEPVLNILGGKSKNQVKRVTWNIQEPEGPQPGKSASKLALYKLKLKQEGARRPSTIGQTSSQDITGAFSDLSKKGAVVVLSSSSKSDGALTEGLSSANQGEAKEGNSSRKDKYLKKLHMQERAIEEVKLAIKPFYQKRDINKDEYKEILRKAVQKVCHSKSGEINPVKVGNLVKAYVDKYKHARKQKIGEDSGTTGCSH